MSSMAGWVGANCARRDVLTRMVEAMSGPRPAIEQQHGDGFAMATTRPALHPSDSHLAVATEADVVVGFAGYLHSTEPQQRQQPAQYCLQLYQRLGTEFPTELNGSFAVAVYDHRARKLLLATDRTATRALYYCQQKHFVFGSEVKAILEYPGISRKLNAERVCEFLAIVQVTGLNTHYDHIKRVPAASVLTWDGTRCQISRYWEPRFDHADAPDIREHAAHAVAVLRRAMGRCCAGAERVGLMLSGGFDSRALAAVSDVDMLCTTLHNVEGSEVATARRVAQALGYEHRFVEVPRSHPLELLEAGAIIGDGMLVYHSAQPLALRGTVETCGIDLLCNGCCMETNFNALGWARVTWRGLGTQVALPLLARLDIPSVPAAYMQIRHAADARTLSAVLAAVEWLDLAASMEARLAHLMSENEQQVAHHGDAMALVDGVMHTCARRDYLNVIGIERLTAAGRPVCDTEMIDLFLATPPEYGFNRRMYAHMFRLLDPALRKIPYAATGVPLSTSQWWDFLNAKLRKRDRSLRRRLWQLVRLRHQEVDRSAWPHPGPAMRECEEWHTVLGAHANDSCLVDLGIVSGDGIRMAIAQHLAGQANNTYLLSGWLTVEQWLRHYG